MPPAPPRDVGPYHGAHGSALGNIAPSSRGAPDLGYQGDPRAEQQRNPYGPHAGYPTRSSQPAPGTNYGATVQVNRLL